MLEDIIKERLNKREKLIESGYDAYPSHIKKTCSINCVLNRFFWLFILGKKVSVRGRVMGFRNQGGIIFADLKDESGNIQIVILKKVVKDFNILKENLDIGDFVFANGKVFKTKAGQKSIKAETVSIITKSLRPMPSIWHGLKDIEERFRKRYLDLILNKEVNEQIIIRSKIVQDIRNTLNKEGFLEVETPILQTIAGGATAKPFTTHHNALDTDFYLRIAPELFLKRILVGGIEKIFEIGRNFRNEGVDRDHNPEFTSLELYWAYQDYHGLMDFVRKLLNKWLPGDWPTVTFAEFIKQNTGKDYKKVDEKELDELYKQSKSKVKEPTFVVDYPETLMPLAKYKKDDPTQTESFQLIANGAELMKGFSEMNDPVTQREQMERQEKEFRKGKEEVARLDEDFIEALEYGMPPAAGLGIGIDRLVAAITKAHAIKEIIIFPTLRPKQ